ncbi:hypothetical protein [Kribbella sp. NPDC048915]|uniref:hypothetical protein n=1 Tax=Kribbella sp. NPDC048915 TaxID=3155148 RepID=UPI0033DED45C
MRKVVAAGLLLLALALGVGGGYAAGDYLDRPTAAGTAAPLGEVSPSPTPSPSEPSLPVKTPVPSNVEPLNTGLEYTTHSVTVTPKGAAPVRLAVETPQGWRLAPRDPERPAEFKYLDKLRERGVRVEAVEPAVRTPADELAKLVVDLKKSVPAEDGLRIISQTSDEQILGDDGRPRSVATLIYTYIPGETLRYVVVRWIAVNDNPFATIEMSITGLPQDATGLDEVLLHATQSARVVG